LVEKHLGVRFENFVADLFRAEGFDVEKEPKNHPAARPDLLIHSKKGPTAVAEIKLYRSNTVSASTLSQAAAIVETTRRVLNANVGILIIGNKVSSLAREVLKQQFSDLLLYDNDTLAFLVAKHPSLIVTFESLIREALAFSEPMESRPIETDIEADIIGPRKPSLIPGRERRIETDLCAQIRSTPSGRTHAKQFETKVMEALRYIFDEDLTAWSLQKSTDTKISVYDLIARVASEHDFWNSIVNQFRSRYIVFEFKNYSTKIKQGQIYTTEKYLFGTALRSTAIIIARNGADRNALAASRGALRENGKLIVNLNIDDLCKMLHLKDRGDDHNAILVERVDEMLMKLER
jgi:hypothetical protein